MGSDLVWSDHGARGTGGAGGSWEPDNPFNLPAGSRPCKPGAPANYGADAARLTRRQRPAGRAQAGNQGRPRTLGVVINEG